MKKMLAAATLGLGTVLGATGAFASDGHRVHYVGPRLYAHIRFAAPGTPRCWIPPCTRQIVIGYDAWGMPICRTVVVREGYWTGGALPCP